jgi:hypothetical protein
MAFMIRSMQRALLLAVCAVPLCAPLHTQSAWPSDPPPKKVITIRMLDSRTGHLIIPDNYLLRVDHQETLHADWVKQNEDGSGRVTLPANATALSIKATYDSTTLIYVNCDTENNHGSPQSAAGVDHWYSVDNILTQGIVAPNYCGGKKVTDKLQVFAKPGEYVFFVRKLNPREQFDN